jgi:mono/diheme cytochrome c family protein
MKIATALLALAVTATVSLTSSGAQVSQQSSQDAAVMERGRYIVEIAAACGVCHTTRGAEGQLLPGMELAGGRVLIDRGFRAVASNITPDPETGIGRWSDAEIASAIREGHRPDGTLIGPPYANRTLPRPVGP